MNYSDKFNTEIMNFSYSYQVEHDCDCYIKAYYFMFKTNFKDLYHGQQLNYILYT